MRSYIQVPEKRGAIVGMVEETGVGEGRKEGAVTQRHNAIVVIP